MYDVFVMVAVIIFVLAWYGLTLAGRAVLKPYEKMKVVWCPAVGSFSYIETEECVNGAASVGTALSVVAGISRVQEPVRQTIINQIARH